MIVLATTGRIELSGETLAEQVDFRIWQMKDGTPAADSWSGSFRWPDTASVEAFAKLRDTEKIGRPLTLVLNTGRSGQLGWIHVEGCGADAKVDFLGIGELK
jgi:hypothetical protein